MRTPTVLQAQVTECGVASLGSVLAYYGVDLPLEELRQRTGVSREGSSAKELLEAARGLGFDARGFRKSPKRLAECELPVIAHVGFGHFVVVERMGEDVVRTNDPICGPREEPRALFEERYTGVVLVVRPTDAVTPTRQRARFSAWGLLRGDRLAPLGALGAGASFAALIATWQPVWALGVWAGSALEAWRVGRAADGWAARAEPFLAHMLRLPFRVFAYRLPMNLAQTVEAHADLAEHLARHRPAGLHLLRALGAAAALAALLPEALLVFVPAALVAWTIGEAQRAALGAGRRHAFVTREGQAALFHDLSLLESLHVNGDERRGLATAAGGLARSLRDRRDLLAATHRGALALCVADVLVPCGLVVWGSGSLVPGLLLPGLALWVALRLSLHRQLAADAAHAALSWRERIHELEELDPPDPEAPPPSVAPLVANDVSFGFAPLRPPTLDGLSLTLEPGEQLGLTGASGSGKSALGGLLAGLHRPWSGEVTLGGRPLTTPGAVAWIDANPLLLPGTVRENLSLFGDTPDEALREAIRDAGLEEVLEPRGGLDAWVRPFGNNFSGGERQRLEIARALARRPAVLILDEAIDAIELDLEAQVRAGLRRRGCSVLLMSHRAETLLACDRVAVLDAGAVVQAGDPGVLIEDAGPLRDLLVGAVAPPPPQPLTQPPRRDADAETLTVFVRAAEAAGLDPTPPDTAALPPGLDAIRAMARRAGLAARSVRLSPPTWWRHDLPPLIATLDGERLVTVLPGVGRPAQVFDPRHGEFVLDAAWAARLDRDAVELVPGREGSLRPVRGELWVAGAATLGLGALGAAPLGVGGAPLGTLALIAVGCLGLGAAGLRARGRWTLWAERTWTLRGHDAVLSTPPAQLKSASEPIQAVQRQIERLGRPPAFGAACGVAALGVWAWVGAEAWVGVLTALLIAGVTGWGAAGDRALAATSGAAGPADRLRQLLFGLGRLRCAQAVERVFASWQRERAPGAQAARSLRWRALGRDVATDVAVASTAAGVWATGPSLGAALSWALGVLGGVAVGRGWAAWVQGRDDRAVMAAPLPPLRSRRGRGAERGPARVEVERVDFAYGGRAVLHGLSLRVEPGEVVAVVGRSGCGKSTLVRVLAGLEQAGGGSVRVDGVPLEEVGSARAGFAAVLQTARLTPANVFENVRDGRAHSVEQVWEVLRHVGLEAEVRGWRRQVQTMVNDGTVSTGQKQRILIARALLDRPRLLILDEATSALNEGLQQRVIDSVRRLGVSCVLVSHRASAALSADRVYVMEGGRVVASGAPRDVLEREGALRRLQQRSPLPEPAEVEEGPAFLGSDVDGLFRPEVVERFGSLYEVNDLLLTPPPRRGWWWAGWAALAGAAVWALG